MRVSHEREKMINANIYFANHTRHLGKIKLPWLLYLLDFEPFSQTGRNVTGLDYHAWKFGLVPVALEQEWEEPEAGPRPSASSRKKSSTACAKPLPHKPNLTTAISASANCASWPAWPSSTAKNFRFA